VVFEDAPTIKNLVVTLGRSDAPGRLEYEDHSAGPDAVSKNVRAYRQVGTRIIVVALECNLADPKIDEFLQIHSGVVESLAALPP